MLPFERENEGKESRSHVVEERFIFRDKEDLLLEKNEAHHVDDFVEVEAAE